MKKILLFASMALFASCATHRYGCGLSSNKEETNRIVVRNNSKNGKSDSLLITIKVINGKIYTTSKLLNYKPDISIYRGYGKVTVIDTFMHPYSYLLKVGGVAMRNDTELSPVKYLVVYEGNFYRSLTPYLNTNTDIYFEARSLFPNVLNTPEIQITNVGCIDHMDIHSKRDDIIFATYKN